MRYLAWLHATPKPPAGSQGEKAAPQQPQLSRFARMKRDRIVPAMPPNPMPHIIGWLTEIGLTEAAGMGAAPLSWREIEAWQNSTGIRLEGWVARLIRRLSVDYLAESRRAEEENCPPPWRAPVTAREREVEIERLRMVLG